MDGTVDATNELPTSSFSCVSCPSDGQGRPYVCTHCARHTHVAAGHVPDGNGTSASKPRRNAGPHSLKAARAGFGPSCCKSSSLLIYCRRQSGVLAQASVKYPNPVSVHCSRFYRSTFIALYCLVQPRASTAFQVDLKAFCCSTRSCREPAEHRTRTAPRDHGNKSERSHRHPIVHHGQTHACCVEHDPV